MLKLSFCDFFVFCRFFVSFGCADGMSGEVPIAIGRMTNDELLILN